MKPFIAFFALISVFGLSKSSAASLNYANSSGAIFSFSQMSEYSYLDTFIGSIPSNIPQVFTDSKGDYLNWIPSTVLDAAAGGSSSSAYATSRFSTVIAGKAAPASVPIQGLEISFDLRTKIGTGASSTVDFNASLYMQIFGINGDENSIPRNFKVTLAPTELTGTWTSSNVVHQGWKTWALTYTISDLEALFQPAGFSPPTMNITKLGLSLTPEITINSTGTGDAKIFMDQMTIAMIPEPNTGALLLFGLASFLRKRRKPIAS